MTLCRTCQAELLRRRKEGPSRFLRREFCSRRCALRSGRLEPASIAARKKLEAEIIRAARAVAARYDAHNTVAYKQEAHAAQRTLNRGGGWRACARWLEAMARYQ